MGVGPLLRGTGRRVGCGQLEMAVTPLLISPLQGTSWPVREEKCGCLLRVLVSVCAPLCSGQGDGETAGWLYSGQGSKYFLRGALQVATCAGKCGCVPPTEE